MARHPKALLCARGAWLLVETDPSTMTAKLRGSGTYRCPGAAMCSASELRNKPAQSCYLCMRCPHARKSYLQQQMKGCVWKVLLHPKNTTSRSTLWKMSAQLAHAACMALHSADKDGSWREDRMTSVTDREQQHPQLQQQEATRGGPGALIASLRWLAQCISSCMHALHTAIRGLGDVAGTSRNKAHCTL